MTFTPTVGREAEAVTLTWNTAPSSCINTYADNWAGVDHYALYRRDGAVYAVGDGCADNTTSFLTSAPISSEWVADIAAGTTTYEDAVYRSAKDFRYYVVACDDSGCNSPYGEDGGELETYGQAWDCTYREEWTVTGVDSLDTADWPSLGVDWVVDGGNAPAALYYPSGFIDGLIYVDDVLGLWWSESCNSKTDCVYMKRAYYWDTGPQDWNSYSSWTTESLVAEETDGNAGDFTKLTHPWVMAVDDGSERWIRMWVQRQNGDVHNHIVGVDSADEIGANFGLEGTVGSGTCEADGEDCQIGDMCDYEDESADGDGEGIIDICADGSAACANLNGARHGRIMWDYLSNGAVDFSTDEPWMVFTGTPDGEGQQCARPGEDDQDDIYLAEWDSTGGEWAVVDDGGTPLCPVDQAVDRHDPAVVPLPDGAFKMYYKEGESAEYVIYWNPDSEAWEDEAQIQIYLDDGFATEIGDCVENMDVVAHDDGGSTSFVMFFKGDSDLQTGGCFDGGWGILAADPGTY